MGVETEAQRAEELAQSLGPMLSPALSYFCTLKELVLAGSAPADPVLRAFLPDSATARTLLFHSLALRSAL